MPEWLLQATCRSWYILGTPVKYYEYSPLSKWVETPQKDRRSRNFPRALKDCLGFKLVAYAWWCSPQANIHGRDVDLLGELTGPCALLHPEQVFQVLVRALEGHVSTCNERPFSHTTSTPRTRFSVLILQHPRPVETSKHMRKHAETAKPMIPKTSGLSLPVHKQEQETLREESIFISRNTQRPVNEK